MAIGADGDKTVDIIALDDAMQRLAELDARQAQAVELHFFGWLTSEEIATALEVSLATVGRDLRFARAWLRRQLADGEA